MKWRERLIVLLSGAMPFAASEHRAAALPEHTKADVGGDGRIGIQPLEYWSDPGRARQALQLAGHSSHASHASHSSHASGSGGGYYTPAPLYTAPAPAAPQYTPPKPAPKPAQLTVPSTFLSAPRPAAPAPTAAAATKSSGVTGGDRLSQDEIVQFIQRVQIALMVKGYDPGPADGDLKPKTKDALRSFQAASSLTPTGNLDVSTLNALGVLK